MSGAPDVSAEAALARVGALVRPALSEVVGRLQPELREPALHHLARGRQGRPGRSGRHRRPWLPAASSPTGCRGLSPSS